MSERPTRTVSLKAQGNSPEDILAIFRAIDRILPGIKVTSGVHLSDHARARQGEPTRFDYDFYGFALVTFELSPSGAARPTQANAIRAFKEGRTIG